MSGSPAVMPGRTRSLASERTGPAWVHGRAGCVPGACGTLGPGAVRWACPGGGLPVEGSSAGSLVAALRAVQIDAAPGRPEMKKMERGGPS